jgi:hypothetical protein
MHEKRKITVNKLDLLRTIHENRDRHQKEYLEALAGYKAELANKLQEQLEKLRDTEIDKEFKLKIDIVVPSHHLQDYDKYINMIHWEVNKDIEITSTEFDNLIRDEWHWTGGFKHAYNTFSGIDIKKVFHNDQPEE